MSTLNTRNLLKVLRSYDQSVIRELPLDSTETVMLCSLPYRQMGDQTLALPICENS